MSTVLPLVGPQRDDYGLILVITIRRPNGSVVDLTTATAFKMLVKLPSGRTLKWTPIMYAMPPQGILQYRPLVGELPEPGRYEAQVQVTVSPTRRWTTQPFTFSVGDNL